jgi:hypothetical protein
MGTAAAQLTPVRRKHCNSLKSTARISSRPAWCRCGSAMPRDEMKETEMMKISQRHDIADTGRKSVLTRRGRELGAAELDTVKGGGADWPPPPGRN